MEKNIPIIVYDKSNNNNLLIIENYNPFIGKRMLSVTYIMLFLSFIEGQLPFYPTPRRNNPHLGSTAHLSM